MEARAIAAEGVGSVTDDMFSYVVRVVLVSWQGHLCVSCSAAACCRCLVQWARLPMEGEPDFSWSHPASLYLASMCVLARSSALALLACSSLWMLDSRGSVIVGH